MEQYLNEYKGKNVLITGGAGCAARTEFEPQGATGDMIITSSETKSKKYKQQQKRSNVLIALDYLKASWPYTP